MQTTDEPRALKMLRDCGVSPELLKISEEQLARIQDNDRTDRRACRVAFRTHRSFRPKANR